MRTNGKDLVYTKWVSDITYSISAGSFGSIFFRELMERKRLLGIQCPQCRRVYVPPRPVCGRCYRSMDEWVEVGPRGDLVAFTIVNFPFLDPATGCQRPIPYGYGRIRLDGASTLLNHFLDTADPSRLRINQRVEAVFEEVRKGNLMDIRHFRILD